MILTGKAKEAFEKWSEGVYDDCGNGQLGKRLFYIQSMDDYRFINTEHYIYNVGDSMLHALIIEWLDSVGIHVYTIPVYHFGGLSFKSIIDGYDLNMEEFYFFKNRPQATEKAIERAVELINGK